MLQESRKGSSFCWLRVVASIQLKLPEAVVYHPCDIASYEAPDFALLLLEHSWFCRAMLSFSASCCLM